MYNRDDINLVNVDKVLKDYILNSLKDLEELDFTDFIINLLDNMPDLKPQCGGSYHDADVFREVIEFFDSDYQCFPYNDLDFDRLDEYAHQKKTDLFGHITMHSFKTFKPYITNESKFFPLNIYGDKLMSITLPKAKALNTYSGLVNDVATRSHLRSIFLPSFECDKNNFNEVLPLIEPKFDISNDLNQLAILTFKDNAKLLNNFEESFRAHNCDFKSITPFGNSVFKATTFGLGLQDMVRGTKSHAFTLGKSLFDPIGDISDGFDSLLSDNRHTVRPAPMCTLSLGSGVICVPLHQTTLPIAVEKEYIITGDDDED